MTVPFETLSAAGWTVDLALSTGPASAGEFVGLFRGEDAGAAQRGVLAVVATATGAMPEAAEIAARTFAEGYFASKATLSQSSAAARSFKSVHDWLTAQRDGASAADLTALCFSSARRPGVLEVGRTRAFLKRGDRLQPLTGDTVHAITADRMAEADFTEIEVEPGDRILLLYRPVTVPASELMRQLAAPESGLAAMTLDIRQVPKPGLADFAAKYKDLPLRALPRDGDEIDGFVIGRTMYRGPYTLIKRAFDRIEQRDVVLKFPLPAMAGDQVFRLGFLREAFIGSTVRSTWCVNYIDLPAGRQSHLYLVMPYYPGKTLDDRIKADTPVSLFEGIDIALQLCQAISSLSQSGVVHRDIKPENIILLPDGNLRLLDLGLAHLPGLDDAGVDNTGGTTRYMAPELFRGEAASERSDIFSAGVTLYRMFTGGAFPFGQRERRPLARLRPDLPPWLGDALKKAMAMDPANRWADARAFAASLETGMTTGHVDTGYSSANRWTRVRRWQIIAAISLLANILLFTLLVLHH